MVTPSYYRSRMVPDALRRHYESLAEASGGPVLLYHVPAFTGIDLPVSVALELAGHPSVRGIKDSSGDLARIERLASGAPPGFVVLTGSAPILYPSLAVGAAGGVVAAACVAPADCCALWAASRNWAHPAW